MTDEEKRLTGEVARLNGMLLKIGDALRGARTSSRVITIQDYVNEAQRVVSDALCGKGPNG